MTETVLQRQCIAALRKAGFWVVRTQSKGRTGTRSIGTGEPGMPDAHVVCLGAWIEFKTNTGKLSAKQSAWHDRARKHGVRVAVVASVNDCVTQALAWRRQDDLIRVERRRA